MMGVQSCRKQRGTGMLGDVAGWLEQGTGEQDAPLLVGRDLRGASLQFASLGRADLTGLIFRGADLRCADLREALLQHADLRDAQLDGADHIDLPEREKSPEAAEQAMTDAVRVSGLIPQNVGARDALLPHSAGGSVDQHVQPPDAQVTGPMSGHHSHAMYQSIAGDVMDCSGGSMVS